jgi:hypothetical protein
MLSWSELLDWFDREDDHMRKIRHVLAAAALAVVASALLAGPAAAGQSVAGAGTDGTRITAPDPCPLQAGPHPDCSPRF